MNHSQHAPIPVDFPVFLKRICENPLTFLIPALRPSGPAAVPKGIPTQLRRSHPKKLHRGAPGMQPRIPIPIPAPGAWRAGGANHPHGHFQPLHSHSRRMEDGITQWDHGVLLGVLSSPFRAPPLPSPAGGDGIRCSPSFLLRPLGMIPWDQHFAPRAFPPRLSCRISCFQPLPVAGSGLFPRLPPQIQLGSARPSPDTAASPQSSRAPPVPPCRPAVPPRAGRSHPLKPPREGNLGEGHPGIQVPSPAALTCRHHVRLQVRALPR